MKKKGDLAGNLGAKTKRSQELQINRGVELMLRRKNVCPPERSGIIFSKTLSIFRRQFKFTLEIDRNESKE